MKRKIWLLTPLPFTVAAVVSCATSNTSSNSEFLGAFTPKYDVENESEGIVEFTNEQKSMIDAEMNEIISLDKLNLQFHSPLSINSVYLDLHDLVNRFYLVKVNDVKYMIELSQLPVKDDLPRDVALDDTINQFNNKRSLIFKFHTLDKKVVINYTYRLETDIQMKFTLRPKQLNPSLSLDDPNIQKINVDWVNINNWFEGEIVRWKDGDTAEVKVLSIQPGVSDINVGETYTIRLAGIDTPEKGVGSGADYKKSPKWEHQFAELATKFAVNTLPSKTVVRLFLDGKGVDKFNRIPADIFFGKDFNISYNTEIVRNGWCLPFSGGNKSENTIKGTLKYYTFFEMAKAMKFAKENRLGLFQDFANEKTIATKVYLTRSNTGYHTFMEEDEDLIYKYKDKMYPN
ncbi:Uncharacterised protein [Mycoplasmopsis californica]|uniref:Thermonuclease family protein n=1 Tax=Mycoplasmopsis equigenitalium TaxID=114883 RepID=A0ABY5J4I6_9BACT|nr:thermonuclease family protein [Mycoplasmopsis equigenitalium]UUD36865.1 thermonuclease family protein [Mycoplasmopsis equigenitalium]VEU69840.1 Uncharacterised protein [Mycoplasmopsis californica]